MNAELEAIKDAEDKSTGDGRDHDLAVSLSEAFVRANPALFEQFRTLSIEDCVRAVDVFRAAGMDEDQWRVEAYLLAKFEPQNIGGEYHAEVRLPEL